MTRQHTHAKPSSCRAVERPLHAVLGWKALEVTQICPLYLTGMKSVPENIMWLSKDHTAFWVALAGICKTRTETSVATEVDLGLLPNIMNSFVI